MRTAALLVTALALLSHVAMADWPQFRGPNSAGKASGPSPAIEFGPGKNELWRVPMGSGHSSPCIVGSSTFLTIYDETQKQLAVICIDRSRITEPGGETGRPKGRRLTSTVAQAEAMPALAEDVQFCIDSGLQ